VLDCGGLENEMEDELRAKVREFVVRTFFSGKTTPIDKNPETREKLIEQTGGWRTRETS
jgi:hypothetical protein